jgi:hypothetical protein
MFSLFNWSILLLVVAIPICFSQNPDLFALNADENLFAAVGDDLSSDSHTSESESYWTAKATKVNLLDFSSNPDSADRGLETDSLLDPSVVDLGLTSSPNQSFDDSLWVDTVFFDMLPDSGPTGLLDSATSNDPSIGDIADGGDQCVWDSAHPVSRVRPRKPVTCPPKDQARGPGRNLRTGGNKPKKAPQTVEQVSPDTLFMTEFGQLCPRHPRGRVWMDVCGRPIPSTQTGQLVIQLEYADRCE